MSIAAPVVFGGALLRAPAAGAAIFIVYLFSVPSGVAFAGHVRRRGSQKGIVEINGSSVQEQWV